MLQISDEHVIISAMAGSGWPEYVSPKGLSLSLTPPLLFRPSQSPARGTYTSHLPGFYAVPTRSSLLAHERMTPSRMSSGRVQARSVVGEDGNLALPCSFRPFNKHVKPTRDLVLPRCLKHPPAPGMRMTSSKCPPYFLFLSSHSGPNLPPHHFSKPLTKESR